MKKILLLILSILLTCMVGCKKTDKENKNDNLFISNETLKVLSPNGTPLLSQMYIENNKDLYNIKVDYAEGGSSLPSAFITKSYDIIYAPLNVGIKMYINNKNYKLLGVVVDLNYYFISNEEITLDSFKNKEIVIFSEANMSGIISRMIFDYYNLEGLNIRYVESVADSMSAYIVNNNSICLVSEPQLSNIELKLGNIYTYSLKEEYEKITGKNNLPQAACFVRFDLDKDVVSKYEEYLIKSIEKINSDTIESSRIGSTLYPSFKYEVLIKALERSEINYRSASDSKNEILDFINTLNSYNSSLLGGDVDEDFYFKK
mgnify:CR=1 FL=1